MYMYELIMRGPLNGGGAPNRSLGLYCSQAAGARAAPRAGLALAAFPGRAAGHAARPAGARLSSAAGESGTGGWAKRGMVREGGSAPKRGRHSLRYCFPPNASVQWQPDVLTIHTNNWFPRALQTCIGSHGVRKDKRTNSDIILYYTILYYIILHYMISYYVILYSLALMHMCVTYIYIYIYTHTYTHVMRIHLFSYWLHES